MCSNLTIKRPERRQRCLNFNFIVSFTYFGDFIVDFQHISHLSDVLYTGKKERKVSLTDGKLKYFCYSHSAMLLTALFPNIF